MAARRCAKRGEVRAAGRGPAVALEMSFVTAQVRDNRASDLNARAAMGGPRILASQRFYVGNHSITLPLNIGLTDAARRTPDMPLYTLTNNITGETVQTTDPGKALLSGKWKDIGKFKGPILRGLAARAPYFHNGMAASLEEAGDSYNTRFNIGFSAREKRDMVAFLRAL